MTPIGMFILIIVALSNLYLFYNQQKIKSNLKKNEFIHKLQFEKEFETYGLIWSKVIDIKGLVFRLGSQAEMVIEGKTFEQIKFGDLYT